MICGGDDNVGDNGNGNDDDTDDNSDLKGALKSPYLTAPGTNQVDYKSNILPATSYHDCHHHVLQIIIMFCRSSLFFIPPSMLFECLIQHQCWFISPIVI